MTATSTVLATLKPSQYWAKLPLFGRKGWRTLPFGEFAAIGNERVEPVDAVDEN